MPIVEVDQRWIEEIKVFDDRALNDFESLVDEALRTYVFYLGQQKIANERRFYEMNHSRISMEYLGKFVAIHNETVIDSDEDGRKLSKRLREQHGRLPIAIIEVRETPEPPHFKVRFFEQFAAGLGDYTEERRAVIENQTLAEVLSEVYQYQAERSAQHPESDH